MKNPKTLLFTLNLLWCGGILPAQSAITLPLQQIDHFIVVRATINYKRTGFFILDTGATCLTLNARYFRGDRSTGRTIYGLHDQAAYLEKRKVDLQIGALSWKSEEALILDLSGLERKSPFKILGLLGVDLFKHMEIAIDYIDGKISFTPPPLFSDPPQGEFHTTFYQANGMPVIEARIGEGIYQLGIDTGAGINILDEKLAHSLSVYYQDLGIIQVQDLSARQKNIPLVNIQGLYLEQRLCGPMLTAFKSMRTLNQSLTRHQLDGLVGLELFKQGKMILNFSNKEMSFFFKEDEKVISGAGGFSSNADTSMLRPPGSGNR